MAGTSFFQILIKIAKQGGGDDEAIKGLYRLKSTIGTMVGVFGAFTGVAYSLSKAFQATGGEFVKYANEVRGMSQAFSMEAEEASRMIQVADDLGISQETLTKALKTMASNGIQPSIAGLQALATQYAAIQDPAAKAAFLTDNFGKAGLDMAAAMRMGEEGLQRMYEAVEQGLIPTKEGMNAARQYEISVDNLSDSFTAFKMTIGQAVVPALNDLLIREMATKTATEEFFQTNSKWLYSTEELNAAIQAEIDRLTGLQQAQIDAEAGATDLTTGTDDLTESTKQLTTEMDILKAALSGDLQEAYDDYSTKMGELTSEHEELTASLQELTSWGYGPTSEKVQDLNEKLAVNEQKQKDVAKATELATAKMIYQQVAAKLDVKGQLELARSLGLISERDYAVASALETLTQQYDANADGVVSAAEGAEQYVKAVQELTQKIKNLPDDEVITITTNFVQTGTPPTVPGTPTCFAAGTLIATPTGERTIESIEPGDDVISLADGKEITTRVKRVFRHEAGETDHYYVINGFLRVTAEHPIHVNNGWMAARNICVGDMLTERGKNRKKVVSVEWRTESIPVFNLEIEHECHNYFADGVLVHNKETEDTGAGYAGGGVAYGPASGHWEMLHGTEAVIPLRGGAVPVMITGGAAGQSVSFAGANINVSISSGASMGDFMQTLMNAAGR